MSAHPGGTPGEDLSTNELGRLSDWVAAKRDEIASDPGVAERLTFWAKVARNLSADALAVLLTAKEQNEERDANTGILNRRGIESVLVDTLEWHSRAGQPLTLVLMDLDRFKAFNEAHGRQAADTVLGEWISFLKSRMRKTDTLGRVGGQEVVALLRGATEEQGVVMFDRVREEMEQALKKGLEGLGIGATVTMSVGVAQNRDGDTSNDLLDQVRSRMVQAKAAGRNMVVGGSSQK